MIKNILTQPCEVFEAVFMYDLLCVLCLFSWLWITSLIQTTLVHDDSQSTAKNCLRRWGWQSRGATRLTTPSFEHMHTWTHSYFCVHTTGFFVCRLPSIPRWGGGGVSRGTCESFYLIFIYHTHEVSKLMDDSLISRASGFADVRVKNW